MFHDDPNDQDGDEMAEGDQDMETHGNQTWHSIKI